MKKVAIAHQYRHLWRFYAKNATILMMTNGVFESESP
jgi:hypothetical protein